MSEKKHILIAEDDEADVDAQDSVSLFRQDLMENAVVDHQGAGKVFVGYRVIPGAPLWRETLATITDEPTLQRLADQLGAAL